jgi:hypothetical protein
MGVHSRPFAVKPRRKIRRRFAKIGAVPLLAPTQIQEGAILLTRISPMTTLSKSLLVATIVSFLLGFAFVTGWIGVRDAVALYVAMPLGAVFFGLFLITHMLEKESEAFDADQRGAKPKPRQESNPASTNPERQGQSQETPDGLAWDNKSTGDWRARHRD